MLKTMRASFHQLKWTLFAVIIVFILGFVYFSGTNTGSSDVSGQAPAAKSSVWPGCTASASRRSPSQSSPSRSTSRAKSAASFLTK